MSKIWGENIEEDFEIPKSGNKKHRAFGENDTFEIIGEDEQDPEHCAKNKPILVSKSPASPQVTDDMPENDLEWGGTRPIFTILRIVPYVIVLVLGVFMGGWLCDAGENGRVMPESICRMYQDFRQSNLGLAESKDGSGQSWTSTIGR